MTNNSMSLSQKLQALAIGLGLIGTALVANYVPLPYRDAVIPMGLVFGIWGMHFGLVRLREWWFVREPTGKT